MKPLVSVMMPVRNGMATLPAVLDAIAAQRCPFAFETVAVDSGSTDGSVELLEARVDRLLQVPPSAFNHGLTRNLGVEACRGEFVVLLVQDAEPASADWLAALVAPLLEDPGLAGTWGRQQPRHDASAITRHYLSGWVAASTQPRTSQFASREHFDRLHPMDRFLACTFDNVCSCIRRSTWKEIPFREVRIAEDLEWSRDVLLAGHRLAFVPQAVVVHSHDRPASYELARTYLVHQSLRRLFGLATVPDLGGLARAVATSLPLHLRCALSGEGGLRWTELRRALALAVAFPLGQYLGVRSSDLGRELLRTRGV